MSGEYGVPVSTVLLSLVATPSGGSHAAVLSGTEGESAH